MVKRIGGIRRKTRSKLRKNIRNKGKLSISKYFQEFKDGKTVALLLEPSVHKGMCHPRFHGKTGVIIGKKGKCNLVEIKDGKKIKTLVVHPVHLKGIQNEP